MPFGIFKKFSGDITNKLSGKTDLLEAVCAGAALVAYADGSCTDDEVATALSAIKSNKGLAAAFPAVTIERTLDSIFERAKGGRSGRAGLFKELDDLRGKPDDAEIVMYAVLDVADNGGIDADEKAALSTIAQRLGVDLNKFL